MAEVLSSELSWLFAGERAVELEILIDYRIAAKLSFDPIVPALR